MEPNRLGPILLGSPLLNVWHFRQTLATCSPCLGSAFAMYCAIGSGAAAAPGAEAAETVATIIAVSTDAMILFHSKDDIDVLCSFPRAEDGWRAGRGAAAGDRIPA